MSDDSKLLGDRIARLERQARRWRLLTIVALFVGVTGAAALTAQQRGVTVTGTKFVLQDSEDRSRVIIEMRGVQPTLSFYDLKAQEQLQITVLPDGRASIKWRDHLGRPHEVISSPGVRPLTRP